MAHSLENLAYLVGIFAACASFIVWLANVWIINPLTKSLDQLSDRINDISKQHDGRLDEHGHRLNRHHDQIRTLRIDVGHLKERKDMYDK